MAMSAGERKAALKYGDAAKVSRQTHRTKGHVSQVIAGDRRDAVVERAIARRIGKPVDEVFEPVDGKASDDGADSLEAVGGSR